MTLAVLQAVVFLAAAAMTGLLVALANRLQLLDVPTARSAHSRPTPVGGGLAIVVPFLLVCGYYASQQMLAREQLLALLGGALVALVGLADDRIHLDLRRRLPLQALAAVWSLFWLGGTPAIDFGVGTLAQSWMLNVLAVLALLWLLNLYNFMDGIDGLAGAELVFVTLVSSFLLITADANAEGLVWLLAALFAAGAGFLCWNWPPAKIFMGDVGSGFIGFTLGLLALLSMQQGVLSVWTWFILLGVFVVDATVTLLRRFFDGQRWYDGHASHAYQNAARHYRNHARVTIGITSINCLWLAPLAWLSVIQPQLGFLLTLVAWLPLIALALRLEAGHAPTAA